MSDITTDPNDPLLGHGSNDQPVPQNARYLVLSAEERAKGFVRPLRTAYWHETCGTITTMSRAIAETYATRPDFYGATYCVHCQKHRPVGPDGEFYWCEPGDVERQAPASQPKVGT